MLPPVDARTIAGSQHERGVDERDDEQIDDVVADRHIPVLVAPDKGSRDTPKRWLNSGQATWKRGSARIRPRARAIRKAKTDRGAALR